MSFDYTLSVRYSWPPTGRPEPPYGPTAIEVMRSCPLRSCFDVSPGYERRLGVAARIGTALHKTLQSLSEQPIHERSMEIIAEEAMRRFYAELEAQKAQSAEHLREAPLQWDSIRINRALEAVMAEAIRRYGSLQSHGQVKSGNKNITSQPNLARKSRELAQVPLELPACEVTVQSKDLVFRGRIDRVELISEGIQLVDYKSAYRDDLPERYARQIQLYAYLWYETTGEWPVEGQVFYPMKGTFYQVPIEEDICRQVVAEAVALIHELEENKRAYEIGMPGDICKVCEYRPWCRPFWNWQNFRKNTHES